MEKELLMDEECSSFEIKIPRLKTAGSNDDRFIEADLQIGDLLFIVGPNGTGKSALMTHLAKQNDMDRTWIVSHRASSFPTSIPSFSPSQLSSQQNSIATVERNGSARYGDKEGVQRFSFILSKFWTLQSIYFEKEFQDPKNKYRVIDEIENNSPIVRLNRIFSFSNLPIQFSKHPRNDFSFQASRKSSEAFPIESMSDGERNALYIAMAVISSESNSIILIDEPERHLHPAVTHKFVEALVRDRPDCAFVISTHDLDLPTSFSFSKALILREVDNQFSSWDADLIDSSNDIPDETKHDILGARRNILFVEGTANSPDKLLYEHIFKDANITVVPKGGCDEVIRSVKEIRKNDKLHWVHAYGIIDGDFREPTKKRELEDNSIYSLPVCAIESIYYHPQILEKIASSMATVLGTSPQELIEATNNQFLKSVSENIEDLSLRIIENKIRNKIISQIPKRKDLAKLIKKEVQIDSFSFENELKKEKENLQNLINEKDLETIISQYPIKFTSGPSKIAKALKCNNERDYSNAVIQLLNRDPEARVIVEKIIGETIRGLFNEK